MSKTTNVSSVYVYVELGLLTRQRSGKGECFLLVTSVASNLRHHVKNATLLNPKLLNEAKLPRLSFLRGFWRENKNRLAMAHHKCSKPLVSRSLILFKGKVYSTLDSDGAPCNYAKDSSNYAANQSAVYRTTNRSKFTLIICSISESDWTPCKHAKNPFNRVYNQSLVGCEIKSCSVAQGRP